MLLGLAAKLDPKHFQKGLPAMGHAAQQDPIMFGLFESDPTHFKKGLGLTAQPDLPILGLANNKTPYPLV